MFPDYKSTHVYTYASYPKEFWSSSMLFLIEPKSQHSWGDRSFFFSCVRRIWNSLPQILSLYHKIQIASHNESYVPGFQGLI